MNIEEMQDMEMSEGSIASTDESRQVETDTINTTPVLDKQFARGANWF